MSAVAISLLSGLLVFIAFVGRWLFSVLVGVTAGVWVVDQLSGNAVVEPSWLSIDCIWIYSTCFVMSCGVGFISSVLLDDHAQEAKRVLRSRKGGKS